ncbi:MAG: hypothetical protein M0Z94_03605 [Dehalococcoidales bacterium]|nr:hypothetical protein [Dehalococcoidales bacterium]
MSESLSLIVRAPASTRASIDGMLPEVLSRVGLSDIVTVTPVDGPLLLSLPDLDDRWEPKVSELSKDTLEDWLLTAYWGRRGCC